MRFLFAASILALIAMMLGAHAVPAPIQLNYQDVTAYLNLSSTQMQSLKAIQSARNQAQQGIVQTLTQKQEQLNALLSASGSNPTEIGQLSLDLYNLRKKLTAPYEPYHSQAMAFLTAEQQNKLAPLGSALQLCSAASQAVTLGLIAPLPGRTAAQ